MQAFFTRTFFTRTTIWAFLPLISSSVFAQQQVASSAISANIALEESLKKQLASIEQQRQAVHRQIASKTSISEQQSILPVEHFIVPIAPPLPIQASCPTLGKETVSELISSAAHKQSLDPALLKAVMKQESGFHPCAVSVKGAQGLMQLMPGTARELHVADAFDPIQNVQAGAAYLRQMLDRYNGDVRLALVGYNAGPSRADQAAEQYPTETVNYVANIFNDLGIDPSGSASANAAPATAAIGTLNEEQMAAIPKP